MIPRRVLVVICLLAVGACAAQVDVYAGGVCLLYRDGVFVQSWPGGYPPELGESAIAEGDEIELHAAADLDDERLTELLELLGDCGAVTVRKRELIVEPLDDPASVAWVVAAAADVPPSHLAAAVYYLRGKAEYVRHGWREFVSDKTLALTGWGAVEVVFEDGALMQTRYQPWGSPAHEQLLEWGVIDGDELAAEYADHPEANGVAEWLVAEGLSLLYEGDFTIVVAYRWE
jgi:hypothetical protein